MSSITAIGTNHAKILTGLKDKKWHSKLAESKAKMWTNLAQVLQDVAEMAVSFKRSRGYALPSYEVNQTSAYSSENPISYQHYSTSKLHTKETQQPQPKSEKLKCWQCQDKHLKKDCPIVTSQSRSKHSRLLGNKEKQHKLFKSFLKKFQNRKGIVNEIDGVADDDSSEEHWNQFFSKFEKLMCEEEGEAFN